MAHPHFYRVKAAALAWHIAQEAINRELAKAREVLSAELVACGLDPQKEYSLNEAEQTVTEAEAGTKA